MWQNNKKKIKMWQNFKQNSSNQNVTKLKTQNVVKLKNWKCEKIPKLKMWKTQKLKMGQNKNKNQNVKKLKTSKCDKLKKTLDVTKLKKTKILTKLNSLNCEKKSLIQIVKNLKIQNMTKLRNPMSLKCIVNSAMSTT